MSSVRVFTALLFAAPLFSAAGGGATAIDSTRLTLEEVVAAMTAPIAARLAAS